MLADRVVGKEGIPLEKPEDVATNMFVRNMDLGAPNAADYRRMEVVEGGLPLFGGAYPELVAAGARARLVVLALEVGGRWSQEASTFVKLH